MSSGSGKCISSSDFQIVALLKEKAITLRLTAGSSEAGYLAEIYPIPKTPTFVIILQGTLKGYITSGSTKDKFLHEIKQALSTAAPASEASSTDAHTPTNTTPFTTPVAPLPAVTAMLEERRVRLEAQRKEHDAKTKAEKIAARAALESNAPADPKREASQKYAAEQRKRQQAAKNDRERVLKQIADDKLARKEKEDLRKEQSRATGMIEKAVTRPSGEVTQKSAIKQDSISALQIRLFDGSTIRTRFPSSQTLREHVRKWIDNQRAGDDAPYTFKQILSPLPNKTIGDAEEEESLKDIGLCPNATLVLVRVQDSTGAFESRVGGMSLRNSVPVAYGLISSGLGMVTGVLGSLLGTRTASTTATAESTPLIEGRANINNTGQSNENREFYNGNSVSPYW